MDTQKNKHTGVRIAILLIISLLTLLIFNSRAHAAGVLTPVGSPDKAIQIGDHQVNAIIENGFARVEVLQTFHNPNDRDLEAVYSFPVPKSASLSEFVIYAGEVEINGEVVPKKKAEAIYQEEKKQGNDAGLATKNSYQTFEFRVAKVPAQQDTRTRFVYYQPLQLDTGIGRFVYPLEDGGTDELAQSFWVTNQKVENRFSANIELKISYPIEDVRIPGFENASTVSKIAEGHYKLTLDTANASLNRDLLVYYKLADNLPGRIDLIPYKADAKKPGYFMLAVTPGVDLKPLNSGADYAFVLDISGSMVGKYQTLVEGVRQAFTKFKPEDRFRIITFNNRANEITPDWIAATPENVSRYLAEVEAVRPNGGTNMYAGISGGINDLDADRATSVILVTDAVTNTGVIDPREFKKLLETNDVRVFGFLLGNSSNWPLMQLLTETSGGFYDAVSNADDIVGKLMLAKEKIAFESMHNAELKIRGVKTFDVTDNVIKKVYRGQQLVLMGRYKKGGTAKVELTANMSGKDKVYSTTIEFPDVDTDYPELERMWALDRIQKLEFENMLGLVQGNEATGAIESLGVQYQLVTDETSMLVLSDEAFNRHNIERRNKTRVATERSAQSQRWTSASVRPSRADTSKPMFNLKAPRIGSGGGALDPISGLVLLGFAGAACSRKRRNRNDA